MDGPGFETLTRVLGTAPSRRALAAVLGSLLTIPWRNGPLVGAKKKKSKKTILCFDGQTIRVSQKKKRSYSSAVPLAAPVRAARRVARGRCAPTLSRSAAQANGSPPTTWAPHIRSRRAALKVTSAMSEATPVAV